MMNSMNPYDAPQSDPWPAGATRPTSVTFGDEPIAVFYAVQDETWFAETFAKQPTFKGNARRMWPAFVLFGLWLVTMFASLMANQLALTIGLFLGIGFVLAIALSLTSVHRSNLLDAFRASPRYNTDCWCQLYREGLVTHSAMSTTVLKWPMITRAIRHPGGYVLVGETEFRWLPFQAMQVGTIDTVDDLIRQNIRDYEVAGK